MILQSHPTGNANVRQTAQALSEAGLLSEFWTCVSWNPDSPLARAAPARVRRQFERRTFSPELRRVLRSQPWREVGRLLAPSLKLNSLTRHESGPFSVDAVFQALDRRVAHRVRTIQANSGLKGVYAGEDGARDTFLAAGERGFKRFYDLPIGYWKAGHRIYREELEREPEWASTLSGLRDSDEKLARKDEELGLADVIFVASSFTRNTLQAAPTFAGRVCLVSYGAPQPREEFVPRKSLDGRLKLLFVGSLSQRKGLSYLLRAVEQLHSHVELTLIGRADAAPPVPLQVALQKHHHIPSLPHSEVLAAMREHDVLVFPSLFEGFGLVILEAMSQGLPVITTTHTAGPDLIRDGEDGWIVPVRSPDALVAKLEQLLFDSELRRAMSVAAWHTAQRQTWRGFREQQAEIVRAELVGLPV